MRRRCGDDPAPAEGGEAGAGGSQVWVVVAGQKGGGRGERPVWTIVGVSLLPQAPESLALYFSAKRETRHFAFSPVHSCAFDCEGLEK